MKNLAGDKDCDVDIEGELTRARIDIVRSDEPIGGEVPARLTGSLDGFTFERRWYYWSVSGPMPLALAEEMYADPIGAGDVRVQGHCACPPPKDWEVDGFVRSYHIDTEAGLRLFADYVRRIGKAS